MLRILSTQRYGLARARRDPRQAYHAGRAWLAPRVDLTAAGQARHRQVRAAVDEVTARLHGGIPADDLATAGRVLTLITARASAELAGG